ncbi:MAG: thiosulfate oxidation carrier protein SoxY [Hydrogenophilus sp.]|nr:thiosulfate oxidation carrier protein SoxY [Hydrogenophilus sp.]
MNRRDVLKAGIGFGVLSALVGAGVLRSSEVYAARKAEEAFKAGKLEDALKALGASSPAPSNDIVLVAPDIAENGAVVPIEIESKIAKSETIAVLVEKNPNIVAAVFHLTPAAEPKVKTRVKMGQTSDVIVLVKADGKYFMTKKEVKVTLGGCGG